MLRLGHLKFLGASVLLVAVTLLVLSRTPQAGADGDHWTGGCFGNPPLGGTPPLTREDGHDIAFDWGSGSPDPAIPADGFSVGWTGTPTLSGGPSRFRGVCGGGARR